MNTSRSWKAELQLRQFTLQRSAAQFSEASQPNGAGRKNLCFSVLRNFDEEGDGPFAALLDVDAYVAWRKEYPAWPLPGAVEADGSPDQAKILGVRWADEEPLDTFAAENVARALAANCAQLEKHIAKL